MTIGLKNMLFLRRQFVKPRVRPEETWKEIIESDLKRMNLSTPCV